MSVGWSILVFYFTEFQIISSINLRQCSTQPNPETNFSRLILIKLCLTNGFARIFKFTIFNAKCYGKLAANIGWNVYTVLFSLP